MKKNLVFDLLISSLLLITELKCDEKYVQIFNEWRGKFYNFEYLQNNYGVKGQKCGSKVDGPRYLTELDFDRDFVGGANSGGVSRGEIRCLSGKCSKSVKFVAGSMKNGIAALKFSDDSNFFARFCDFVADGIGVEFDVKGEQRAVGIYGNGIQKYGWRIFDKAAIFGNRSIDALTGKNFVLINFMENDGKFLILRSKLRNGFIVEAEEVRKMSLETDGNGILFPVVEKTAENSRSFTFKPGNNVLGDAKDVVSAQSTWLSVNVNFRLSDSVFVDPGGNLQDLVTNEAVRGFEDNEIALKDPKCNRIVSVLPLKEDSVLETPLVCAPGSGSKWIMNLIEWSTGIRSYFQAIAVFSAPYYKRGAGLFTKTHHTTIETPGKVRERMPVDWRMNHMKAFFGYRGDAGLGAVLLLRNPYDAILSYWAHKSAQHEMETPKDFLFSLRSKGFQEHVRVELAIWRDIAMDWITISPRLLVLHYEHFKTSAGIVKQLERVHRFINYPVDDKRIECIVKHPATNFKRKWKPKITKETFNREMRVKIDSVIAEVQTLLREHGHELMPVDKYAFTDIREGN